MELRNPGRQHLRGSALATGKHPGEQREHRVSRYKEQTEQRSEKVPDFCRLWTQPGTGTPELAASPQESW